MNRDLCLNEPKFSFIHLTLKSMKRVGDPLSHRKTIYDIEVNSRIELRKTCCLPSGYFSYTYLTTHNDESIIDVFNYSGNWWPIAISHISYDDPKSKDTTVMTRVKENI